MDIFFLNDYEFSSLQGQNTKIDYKISVLNGTIKANTSYDFPVFFLQFLCPAPFQIKNRPSVSTFMKLGPLRLLLWIHFLVSHPWWNRPQPRELYVWLPKAQGTHSLTHTHFLNILKTRGLYTSKITDSALHENIICFHLNDVKE